MGKGRAEMKHNDTYLATYCVPLFRWHENVNGVLCIADVNPENVVLVNVNVP